MCSAFAIYLMDLSLGLYIVMDYSSAEEVRYILVQFKAIVYYGAKIAFTLSLRVLVVSLRACGCASVAYSRSGRLATNSLDNH